MVTYRNSKFACLTRCSFLPCGSLKVTDACVTNTVLKEDLRIDFPLWYILPDFETEVAESFSIT